jgi:hypothetical protein
MGQPSFLVLAAALLLAGFSGGCATMGTEAHMQKPQGHGPISDTLNKHRDDFDACIPQSYALNSGESMRLIVTFTLDDEGAVKNPDVESMSGPDPEFRTCVIRKLKKIPFPPPLSGKSQAVRYPLIFVQSSG